MRNETDWQRVGEIGVDAGICWIGDPCYILHRTPKEQEELAPVIGADWLEFCDKLHGDNSGVTTFPYALGHDGLGVVVSTGYGDGVYPVFVRYDKEGRVV